MRLNLAHLSCHQLVYSLIEVVTYASSFRAQCDVKRCSADAESIRYRHNTFCQLQTGSRAHLIHSPLGMVLSPP